MKWKSMNEGYHPENMQLYTHIKILTYKYDSLRFICNKVYLKIQYLRKELLYEPISLQFNF